VDKETNIPQHIAIIMDGNGRWAKDKRLPRVAGHREGTKRVKEIVHAAREFGVKVLTLFVFSNENWLRPKNEVDTLMRYLGDFLEKEIKELHKNNVKFMVIGRSSPLPENILKKIDDAQRLTRDNTGLVLVLALNYGARQEIVDAARKFADSVLKGQAKTDELDEKAFSRYLYTQGLPDPDLLIRTSGEVRISNFLLWQLSYSELYFPKKYWPDFRKEDFELAIKEYERRQRRFGGVEVKTKDE
jgi:undecaprenyl diphosphate synthase